MQLCLLRALAVAGPCLLVGDAARVAVQDAGSLEIDAVPKQLVDQLGNNYTALFDRKAHLDCEHLYCMGNPGEENCTAAGGTNLADDLFNWCDSRRVPEHLRVPEVLRGFYWMKGHNKLGDVGFCSSLAEWNEDRLEALLPPWATFVFFRKAGPHEYTGLAAKAAGMVRRGKHRVWKSQVGYPYYRLKFRNDSLVMAQVKFSGMHRPLNGITNLPLTQIPSVPNTTIAAKEPGDIWDRPSFVFGKMLHRYWAIRVMDDNGRLQPEWYKMMQEAELGKDRIYMRYTETCKAHPHGPNPTRAQKEAKEDMEDDDEEEEEEEGESSLLDRELDADDELAELGADDFYSEVEDAE